MREIDLFKKLPYLDEDMNVVEGDDYNPTLYPFDDKWIVAWCDPVDGYNILSFVSDTPEEVIKKAYKWCKDNKKL